MEESGGSSQACWGRGEVLITSAGRWATSAGTVRCWKRHDTAPCSRPLRAPRAPARARPLPPSRDLPGSAPGRGPRLPGLPRSLPPRPRQQWGPARESGSRGASPASPRPARACATAGAALTFPSRHARGPGPAESWVVFLFFTPNSTAFRPARRPTPRPEKPTDVHTHRRRPVQLTPKCGGAARLGRGLRAPTSPLLGGHLTGAPPSLARARARDPHTQTPPGAGKGRRACARARPACSGEGRGGKAGRRAHACVPLGSGPRPHRPHAHARSPSPSLVVPAPPRPGYQGQPQCGRT